MKYSIFLSTTDFFEDVWNPFFTLFKEYWSDYSGKIYMSTEFKDYSFPGLNILPLKVCTSHKWSHKEQAPWGQRMIWGLEQVKEDIILFLEEDFLFTGQVKTSIIEKYVDVMISNSAIKCIYLNDKGAEGTIDCEYKELNLKRVKRHLFRTNCQAALWRKEELLQLLRTDENIWEFETFGSKRSNVLMHDYLAVDRSWVKYKKFEIIPYLYTGVFRGKWNPDALELFKHHNIVVDTTKREVNPLPEELSDLSVRVATRIERIPKYFKCYLELVKIYLSK